MELDRPLRLPYHRHRAIAREEPSTMRCKRFRRSICVLLIVSLTGCRTAYELDFSSKPSGADVIIGGQVYGTTPCTAEIPRDSEDIQDHLIEITYSLPDGRSISETYDLREYERPNPVGWFVGGIVAVPGVLILALVSDDDEDEDEFASSSDDDESDGAKWVVGLIGLGLVAVGALIAGAFGPGEENNDIFVVFKETAP